MDMQRVHADSVLEASAVVSDLWVNSSTKPFIFEWFVKLTTEWYKYTKYKYTNVSLSQFHVSEI